MHDVRPAVFDLLLLLRECLVQYMALALDCETERLNEGREETDSDADGYRDAGVARTDGHERETSMGRRESISIMTDADAL